MPNQIFKENVSNEILFEFLEKFCIKKDKYFIFDLNSYKKMIFHDLYKDFVAQVIDHYHKAKQFYLERKITYNSMTTIFKQICKCNSISYTSEIKYNESTYTIVYYIYFL
jgi:inorganic pyrophosphatase/exopolyphosphatase